MGICRTLVGSDPFGKDPFGKVDRMGDFSRADKMILDLAEIKNDVQAVKKDLSLIELVTANNWGDIAKLKIQNAENKDFQNTRQLEQSTVDEIKIISSPFPMLVTYIANQFYFV